MREIKFRAYDKHTKIMLPVVDVIKFTKSESINIMRDGAYGVGVTIPYQPSIELMQFTGLHDENGKEIYEGDIVKFKHRDKTIMAPVKYGEWQESKCDEYDCPHYGYYIDYKWDNYCENTGFDLYEKIVEVVGNIYENPELLKGADNIE